MERGKDSSHGQKEVERHCGCPMSPFGRSGISQVSQVMNEVYLELHKKINKHTDQLISGNALGLAHTTIQFHAIKFVQKYYQP